jgi:hypothetical protein
MNISQQVDQQGLVKMAVDHGGSLHPLIIPADQTSGTGLMNPSIYVDGDRLLVNIRHVNYTLYHSENQRFQHRYGPLQYLHPENDIKLRTWNYLCELNPDLTLKNINKVDTSLLDREPLWEFIGLEDARLVRWAGDLYMSGVRRDTTTHGEGRMELSKIENNREVSRVRIPAPGANNTYCEKNWMPVLDQPFHWVKWTDPTEIVKYDFATNTTTTEHLSPSKAIANLPDHRGSSQAVPYGNYYIAVTHEVDLTPPIVGQKNATYQHRFVVWDRLWNIVTITDAFTFMNADIEFCCGLAEYQGNFLISFGFQDNCAFILKVPTAVIEQFLGISQQDATKKTLNWGKISENSWFRQTCYTEIFVDDCYQRFFKVEPGDVVLDVGASIGPFSWSILDANPAQIFCVEAHLELYQTLVENLSNVTVPVTAVNRGIGPSDGKNYLAGMFDPDKQAHSDGHDGAIMETITFQSLIDSYSIAKIDFLKTDCEGGEWDIFNKENFDWITQNVQKIAGEFHLTTPELKQKWIQFRDLYLRHFDNFQILSLDYVDIKWDLWNDHFINYYSAVMVYIDNRRPNQPTINKVIPIQSTAPVKQKWQQYPAPTMEITTIIPEKGCVVDCVFCPQRTLESAYQGERILTLDNFKHLLACIPSEVRITFAGFVEPWMNKYCTDMLLHAYEQGHPISVFTTAVGMSIEDCERIVDIPYAGNPNGGFVLHLPDAEGLAKHPMTAGYRKTLDWLSANQHRIKNFTVMSMGAVHPDVADLFGTAVVYQMYDRAGNLSREAIIKPELKKVEQRWIKIPRQDEQQTCGCAEHLYHNVLLPNGDVSLCCMDYALENIIGNLYRQTYAEVVPEPNTCFDMCRTCENGVKPLVK